MKTPAEDPNQESMIVVTEHDGRLEFWDGSELQKRIHFASIGLDLCLPRTGNRAGTPPLHRLGNFTPKHSNPPSSSMPRHSSRRMLTSPSSPAASCSPTSTRRCSTGTSSPTASAAQDSPQGALQEIPRPRHQDQAHLPELLDQYDINKLADALDPTADLDFDYLGVQTLYDRYLIVDKTGDKPRRLETPQFFWMRVAMGLFRAEKEEPRSWASASTTSTKAAASAPPRPLSSTPAPSTPSFPPATSTRSTTPSSPSCSAALRKTPTSANGPVASVAHGPPSAAPAATSRAPMASPRASSHSSNCTTTSSWPSTKAANAAVPAVPTSSPGTTTSRTSSSSARTPVTTAAAVTT